MPMMKNVLGLDIGSHAIKAVEIRQTLRGLEPVQLRLQAQPDDGSPVADVLTPLIRAHQLSTEHISSALPGDRVSNRRLEFPFRDKKKLALAVPFEVEAEIPFELEDVVVDWQLIEGERNHASVCATIAQRSDVSDFLAGLAEAGCPPRVLEGEGLVLGNLCGLFEIEGKRLILDIGHRKTTLCLVVDGVSVAARTIRVGGQAITEAMARDLGLDLAEAERTKCEHGLFDADFTPRSASAAEVLDRISREVLRSLQAQADVLGGGAISQLEGIVLVGGSARLHRIDEFIAERTGIATGRLGLPSDPEAAALVAGGDPMLFAPAIALALRSTARASTSINFRQDEFAYRTNFRNLLTPEMRPTMIMAAVLLLLLGVSTTTSLALESRRADVLEAQAVAMYSQLFPDSELPERPIQAMSQAVTEARARADFLGLYGGNNSALDLLMLISKQIPQDLVVKFEEVSIDRQVIRIKIAAESYEAMDRMQSVLREDPVLASADVAGQAKRLKDGSITFALNIPLAVPGEEE
jgi:general secretion pathway protein L